MRHVLVQNPADIPITDRFGDVDRNLCCDPYRSRRTDVNEALLLFVVVDFILNRQHDVWNRTLRQRFRASNWMELCLHWQAQQSNA